MEKNNLSEQQSLSIILDMVNKAKANIEDSSFYYLFWGWLVFAASMLHYALLMADYEKPYLPWMLMPIGGIITAAYSYKQGKKATSKSYIEDFMKYVLIAFLVTLLIVLFSMSKLELNTYPMVMLIYGTWLFISGGALKFMPLIIGGIINWTLAIVAFYFAFEMQLLILAFAVLFGYIIPGHLLKLHFKKLKQNVNVA